MVEGLPVEVFLDGLAGVGEVRSGVIYSPGSHCG
jgi:hypothetical protein